MPKEVARGHSVKKTGVLTSTSSWVITEPTAEELMALTMEHLWPFAVRMFKAANSRIRRIEKANLTFTPALDAIGGPGTRFSTAMPQGEGALNAARFRLFEARQFIMAKTSTLQEARKFDAAMKMKMAGAADANINKDTASKVWEIFRKAQETNFASIDAYGSDNVVGYIYRSVKDGQMDEDDILTSLQEIAKNDYETRQEEMEADIADDLDGFFW